MYEGPERRGEDRVITQLVKMDGKLDRALSDLEELTDSVKGTPGSPGLEIKVDRLEQRAKRQDLILGGVTVSVGGIIATWVKGLFH